jgi:hypothetical protein
MTLARGSIRGYDDDRMVLLFSMMEGTREVPCAVSGSAMEDLEHVPRTPADQREEQFTRLRDRIEACASRKFLAREFEGRIPSDHFARSEHIVLLVALDFRPIESSRSGIGTPPLGSFE